MSPRTGSAGTKSPNAPFALVKRDHRDNSAVNLAWAAGYNVAAIPLAAGVLAGAGFVLPMAAGAVLMSLSTIVVAINAQFLRRVDLRPEAAG